MLTEEQKRLRAGKLTASRVGILMSGDEGKIYDLWREVIGDPDYSPPDLSGIWAVALGSHTEELNLDWYKKKTGRAAIRRGEVIVHPDFAFAAATLDGWDEAEAVCIECKHVGGRESLDKVLARYHPQFTWQMIVTGTKHVYASIIEGANEPLIERIDFDRDYASALWQRARDFMRLVESMTPPSEMPIIEPPPPAINLYDMTGDNEWANGAVIWLENFEAAKKKADAEKQLKAKVPADARVCRGHGIEITRDRASRLSLRAA